MQALIQVHKLSFSISTCDLFLSAFKWRYGKEGNVEEDARAFDIAGRVPPYVVDYLIGFYGAV